MTENTTFVSRNEFVSLAKRGEDTEKCGLRKAFVPDTISKVEEKAVKDPDRIFRFTISTEAVDRHNDTIAAKGWKLTNYRKSPVVLFGHDDRSPPIGRAANVKIEEGKLKADVEFMSDDVDTTGRSDLIYRMVSEGFLKATSVGFIPIKYDFVEDDEERAWGVDFKQQELLEFSIVPVPANPECLIEASSKSIDLDSLQKYLEEILDDWEQKGESLLVPKKLAEKSYSILKRRGKPLKLSEVQREDLLRRNLKAILSQGDEMKDATENDTDIKAPTPEDAGNEAEGKDASENEVDLSKQLTELKELLVTLSSDLKSVLGEIKDSLVSATKGGGMDDDEEDEDDKKGGGYDDEEDEDDKKSVEVSFGDMGISISGHDSESTARFLEILASANSKTEAETKTKDEDIVLGTNDNSQEDDEQTLDLLKEILPGIIDDVVGEKFNDILDQKRGKVK